MNSKNRMNKRAPSRIRIKSSNMRRLGSRNRTKKTE